VRKVLDEHAAVGGIPTIDRKLDQLIHHGKVCSRGNGHV